MLLRHFVVLDILILSSPYLFPFDFCLFWGGKMQAIAIVIDRNKGKLVRLSAAQLDDLEIALGEFKKKYGIANEQYHYTPYAERAQTDAFVQGGGATMKSKAHSTDFHLKIRISSKMYTDLFPIFTLFDFGKIRREVEPVMYNFSRETVPWAQIRPVIMEEAKS